MILNFLKKDLLDIILVTLLVATVFIILSKWIEPIEEWGGDYAAYLTQGISLSKGDAQEYIQDNTLSVGLSDKVVGPITYPWGYPIIIAIIYVLGGGMLTLKWLSVIFFSLFIVTTWSGFRKDYSRISILIVTLFILLNTEIQRSIGNIGSDIPFMFFSTLALVLISRSISKKGNTFLVIMTAISIAVSFLIRSTGIILLATLFAIQGIELVRIYLKEKKVSKELIRNIAWETVIFGVVAVAIKFALPSKGSYLDDLVSINAELIWGQAYYYFNLFRGLFVSFPYDEIIFNTSVVLFIAGIVLSLKERGYLAIYFILTITMLVIWPFQQGIRFISPVLIVYLFLIISTLEFGFSKLVGKYKSIPMALILVAVVFFLGGDTVRVLENRATYFGQVPKSTPYSVESQAVFRWSRDNIKNGEIVIFFKPRVFRYQTSLDSISITQIENIDRGDYLVEYLYEDTQNGQFSEVEIHSFEDQGVLNLVYENSKYNVYRIDSSD